jgi:hypothetical protein
MQTSLSSKKKAHLAKVKETSHAHVRAQRARAAQTKAAAGSWWLSLDRASLQQKAREEQARMSASSVGRMGREE